MTKGYTDTKKKSYQYCTSATLWGFVNYSGNILGKPKSPFSFLCEIKDNFSFSPGALLIGIF